MVYRDTEETAATGQLRALGDTPGTGTLSTGLMTHVVWRLTRILCSVTSSEQIN